MFKIGVRQSAYNLTRQRLKLFGLVQVTVSKVEWHRPVSSYRNGYHQFSPTKLVRDLGVILDNELHMKTHVHKISGLCFYQLRRLKKIRRILGPDIAARLLSAYIIRRLDYCTSVLAGLPKSTTAPLRRVQNSAARLVKWLEPCVHISSALRNLHWLPVNFRVTYKLCLMMHAAHNHRCPKYISRLVTSTTSIPSRSRLLSAISNRYEVPKTRLKFGKERSRLLDLPHGTTSPKKLPTFVN